MLGSFARIYFFGGSVFGQGGEGGEVSAFETGFEPGNPRKTGAVHQRTVCAGEQPAGGFVGPERLQAAELTVEHGSLQFAKGGLTPVCGGHHSDQGVLDGGAGREVAFEDGEFGGEIRHGCGAGKESPCAQAVAAAVPRGVKFSMGADRPAGFGAVSARGCGAFFGNHAALDCECGFHLAISCAGVWRVY
jgi:hypothetical protein